MTGAPITFPRGREVVLGVSAGIAAYKSCELLRRLQDAGFLVTVVPTQASLNFVGRQPGKLFRVVQSPLLFGRTLIQFLTSLLPSLAI